MFTNFRRNTHKTTAIGGAAWVFLGLGMALLILAGDVAGDVESVSAQEKKSANAEKSVKSSKIPQFFSSWRLKGKSEDKKGKSDATKKTVKKPAETPVEKPPTPEPVAKPLETTSVPSVQNETEVSTIAPLPPEIDYSKAVAGSTQNETTKAEKRSASAGPDVQKHEEPKTTSLASYSFDSRDWVEYFPVDNLPENLPASPSKSAVIGDPFSSAQTTPIHTAPIRKNPPPTNVATIQPTSGRSAGPMENRSLVASTTEKKTDFSDEWNGTAMPIAASKDAVPGNEAIRIASAKPAEVRIDRRVDRVPEAEIDLTPSYAKHLKYAEVCGVVVVQSNFPLTEIRAILEEIKLLQRDLNLYMGVPAPKEKIELCLFRNEATYVAFLREVFPKAPRDRRALYVKLDNKPGTLMVQKTAEFEVDLRHEMTHAIIHASIRDVPIWLDEGLAKYFEVPIENRADNNPYMKTIRWNVRFGSVPPLERLEKLKDITQMGAREYRDSWAWVHFMIHHSPQTHRLLAGYLQLLATLPEPEDEDDTVQVPPLTPYLKDMIGSPRTSYRKHFRPAEEGSEDDDY